ncbi:MAG: hypothetical protein WC959_05355 [Kiritimatiellales bacterium]
MDKYKFYVPAYFWHSLYGRTPTFEQYLDGFRRLKQETGIAGAELAAFAFSWDDKFAENEATMKAMFEDLGIELCNYRIISPDCVSLDEPTRLTAIAKAEKSFQNAAAFGIPNVQIDTLSAIQIYANYHGVSPDIQTLPDDFDFFAIRQLLSTRFAGWLHTQRSIVCTC